MRGIRGKKNHVFYYVQKMGVPQDVQFPGIVPRVN